MIDDSETHAPVVQWSTVCFFVVISIHLGWMTRSVNWVNAFPQALLDKPTFMCTPRGFMNKHGEDGCLKAVQSLCGSKFAPKTWCPHLHKVLLKLGFRDVPSTNVCSIDLACSSSCMQMMSGQPHQMKKASTDQSRNFETKDLTQRWKVTSPNALASEWNTEMMEACA